MSMTPLKSFWEETDCPLRILIQVMHFQYDLLKFVRENLKNNKHVYSDHTKEPYT